MDGSIASIFISIYQKSFSFNSRSEIAKENVDEQQKKGLPFHIIRLRINYSKKMMEKFFLDKNLI